MNNSATHNKSEINNSTLCPSASVSSGRSSDSFHAKDVEHVLSPEDKKTDDKTTAQLSSHDMVWWLRKINGCLYIMFVPVCLIVLGPIVIVSKFIQWLTEVVDLLWNLLMNKAMQMFVDLFYIHSCGQLHSTFLKKSAFKQFHRPHSRSIRVDVISAIDNGPISVHTIAQLVDNYAYLLVDRKVNFKRLSDLGRRVIDNKIDDNNFIPEDIFVRCHSAILIDCSDAEGCISAIDGISRVHYAGAVIEVECIMTTHHHWDHQAGNIEFQKLLSNIQPVLDNPGCRPEGVSLSSSFKVYGSAIDNVLGCTNKLIEGDTVNIGSMRIEIMITPCHTRGSLIYKLKCEKEADCLFTGDTLFIGGCGAFFEGSENGMLQNFFRLQSSCSPSCLLFPGHEYTERFLQDYFPEKAAELSSEDPAGFMTLCYGWYKTRHLRSLSYPAPTVPWVLGDEIIYNNLFRTNQLNSEILNDVWKFGLERQLVSFHLANLISRNNNKKNFGNSKIQNNTLDPNNASSLAVMNDYQRLTSHVRPSIVFERHGKAVVMDPAWVIQSSNCGIPFVAVWKSKLKLLFAQILDESTHRSDLIKTIFSLTCSEFPELRTLMKEFEMTHENTTGHKTAVSGSPSDGISTTSPNNNKNRISQLILNSYRLMCVSKNRNTIPSAKEIRGALSTAACEDTRYKNVKQKDFIARLQLDDKDKDKDNEKENDLGQQTGEMARRIIDSQRDSLMWNIAMGNFSAVIEFMHLVWTDFNNNKKNEEIYSADKNNKYLNFEFFKNNNNSILELSVKQMTENFSIWVSGNVAAEVLKRQNNKIKFNSNLHTNKIKNDGMQRPTSFMFSNDLVLHKSSKIWNLSSLECLAALSCEMIMIRDFAIHDFCACAICAASKVIRPKATRQFSSAIMSMAENNNNKNNNLPFGLSTAPSIASVHQVRQHHPSTSRVPTPASNVNERRTTEASDTLLQSGIEGTEWSSRVTDSSCDQSIYKLKSMDDLNTVVQNKEENGKWSDNIFTKKIFGRTASLSNNNDGGDGSNLIILRDRRLKTQRPVTIRDVVSPLPRPARTEHVEVPNYLLGEIVRVQSARIPEIRNVTEDNDKTRMRRASSELVSTYQISDRSHFFVCDEDTPHQAAEKILAQLSLLGSSREIIMKEVNSKKVKLNTRNEMKLTELLEENMINESDSSLENIYDKIINFDNLNYCPFSLPEGTNVQNLIDEFKTSDIHSTHPEFITFDSLILMDDEFDSQEDVELKK